VLELDHVFCLVPPAGDWAARLTAAGWPLDAGTAHAGQGSRNRRLIWSAHYLELLWIEDDDAARSNPLRLDRRADWMRTGASPFGFGLRGRLPDPLRGDYWRLDGLPMQVWVHRDSDRAPQRPLVFVLDLSTLPDPRAGGRTAGGHPARAANPGGLRSIGHAGPEPAALPPFAGPPVVFTAGPHRLTLSVDAGTALAVTDLLALAAWCPTE
jgi:Glyoxalase-like domain